MVYLISSNLHHSSKQFLNLVTEFPGLIAFVSIDVLCYLIFVVFVIFMRCQLDFNKIEFNVKVILSLWFTAFLNGNWGMVYIYSHNKTLGLPILIAMAVIRSLIVWVHVLFYMIIRCQSRR